MVERAIKAFAEGIKPETESLKTQTFSESDTTVENDTEKSEQNNRENRGDFDRPTCSKCEKSK